DGLEESHRQFDDFCIRSGGRTTHQFETNLVGFAEAALLGALVAEDWGDVIEPLNCSGRAEGVLDKGAHSGRGALRFESDVTVAFVPEAIHLLRDDVAR